MPMDAHFGSWVMTTNLFLIPKCIINTNMPLGIKSAGNQVMMMTLCALCNCMCTYLIIETIE